MVWETDLSPGVWRGAGLLANHFLPLFLMTVQENGCGLYKGPPDEPQRVKAGGLRDGQEVKHAAEARA